MSQGDGDRFRPNRQVRRWLGPIFGTACFLATLTGVVVLIVLLGAILFAALAGPPHHPWYAVGANMRELFALLSRLISQRQSSDPAIAGYRVGLVGSLWLLGLVALIGIPAGIGAGVFLEEYAPPGRLKRIVQTNIANLAGVPSIVYGILGLALFVRAFGVRGLAMGPSLVAGAFTLGLLILPIIVITTQEALRTVPNSLRQAALALGATKWQVVSGHVLPMALPGIMTGTILGLSRAVGETAPLLMVGAAGSILRLPRGPLDRYTALPVEIYNYAKEPNRQFQTIAAGGILILLVLLLSMNAAAILIRNRFRRYR
ncbi:phosphate ABC transporter permease PstA [Paludisphaera borealis]|uniref:Phosphate transport system permease protein PstA n=1 Tax=Paludisphaera borealis TaxID=1387353 RepID=A0A1U7CIF9_9BACT|nr:phosphate ABC transporter permease PstA [Paludisphaera borealis]APW58730.1 Phosphate transport system permease protein PstA [Paludisphaera borealis]